MCISWRAWLKLKLAHKLRDFKIQPIFKDLWDDNEFAMKVSSLNPINCCLCSILKEHIVYATSIETAQHKEMVSCLKNTQSDWLAWSFTPATEKCLREDTADQGIVCLSLNSHRTSKDQSSSFPLKKRRL